MSMCIIYIYTLVYNTLYYIYVYNIYNCIYILVYTLYYIVVYDFCVCGRFVFVPSVYVYMYVDVILCMAYHHSYKGCSSAAILGMYIQELW